MKERPILVAVIGYIIGILWGLYFRFSIVLCYILMLAIYYISKKLFKFHKKHKFKLLSFSRYSRYLKLIINSKVIFILIIFSVISNTILLFQNNKYDNLYQDGESIQITGIVVSQKEEKQYYDVYQVKVLNPKHFNLYIQMNKNTEELEYGDKVKLQGEYRKPSEQRNYGSYYDKQYLKTLKILGRVKANQVEIIAKKQLNIILQCSNKMNLNIKKTIEKNFDEEKSAILKGLLLGETKDIQEDVRANFQISNISHVLAISGMHISYMILGVQVLLKRAIGKKKTRIATIIILIMYVFITGFSPSVVRAVVMGVITIGDGIVHRKSDVWNSIAISLLGILLYNPFLILNVGLQLSYLGTISIILFRPTILQIFDNIKSKKKSGIIEKTKEILAVSLSAQIMILPILLYHFNIIGIYFLITNLLVSLVIGPIIILGFVCIMVSFIFNPITKLFAVPLNIGLEFLNLISEFSKLPLSKIYIPTPSIMSIILYFIGVLIGGQIYSIYHLNHLMPTHKRVKNIIALFQYKFRQKKKKYLKYLLIILIVLIIGIPLIPKSLKIYFVDVGQGDCTFIITPRNKTILIDGGGSLTDNFDVGKKTLVPYLLDRGYTTIDYVMISHFDQDHVGGILSVLEELKVKNVIISKQGEETEQYKTFVDIVRQKKIKVTIVQKGSKIQIENGIYFDILWPQEKQIIDNILNNNAIMAKLHYQEFSMLFTGDIEKKAEELLLEEKVNLKANVLKTPHHRFKKLLNRRIYKSRPASNLFDWCWRK